MNQGYPLVTLGEVIKLDLDQVRVDPTTTYEMVGVYSFGRGLFRKESVQGNNISYKYFFRLKATHIVMSQLFGWEGALALSSSKFEGLFVSSQFPTFLCDETRLDRHFLGWLIKRPSFWEDLGTRAKGMGDRRRTLNPDSLLRSTIPLPALEEQQRIVVRLEEMVGKIEEVRSLRQQVIKETKALRVSSAKAIFNELAQADTQPLRELVTVQGGGTPSKQNPFFWEGSIPWISPKDMKRLELTDSIDHISEQATLKSSARLLEPGSILIVVRGMILAHTVPLAILRVPATINQDMKALSPSKKITPEYLCCVLWTLNDLLLELVEKSTHDTRKLETPKLLNFKIPVPPLPEQRRIVAYLDELQTKVDTMKQLREQAMKELDALLPSILDKAFKGEL